ncbi:Outer membrane protein/protective antigen OMA87 [Serratia rubidaea]|uniref:BamA/TamA family outer membrane protein n=1 Tax=Serratia rubidaea TaxID=61652 RepID=UPI0006C759F0|nr:BamA/TamA family outer membrane protein [Serratia rubidaea]MCR1000003.1 BamA/TamA family outer membrane protein [Serratia rubidaea]MDK1705554.1 BamA/TamA family outer membrane protein [Serratia rubidaea]QPR65171.1 BamA/TamA family outer membrane protein [Serratia rubidaea]CAI0970496.1 Outer membrane protein/protective antigen OMA87 [Serratia rubidaea]CAI1777314.1 Outer membrane protein/protective antigen OMA87 [Serratia rubidaea]
MWRWLPLLLLAAHTATHAALPSRQQIDDLLRPLGADNQFDHRKAIDWGVLPGPFYTPELGLGIGTAVVGMYRPDSSDSVSQNSTLALKGFFSSTGAFGIGFENYSFFANDQWRFFTTGSMKNMPTYYWGTGYQAGRRDGNKEKYTQQSLQVAPAVMYRIADATYLGLGWDFSSTHADDPDNGDHSLFLAEAAGPSSVSSGVSARFSYDTRDFVANASRGQYFNLTYTHFAPELGSDSRFETLESQYNLYHSLSAKSVLALDLYGRFASGEVPWDRLSELGNDNRMRGYYQGRYRDRNAFSGQLEYRRKLNWRHGYVLWAGTGTMSRDAGDLGRGNWLPTVGAGYRFEFKPRMNVRLDFGVGRQSSGFYFQVGEAF